MLIYLIVLATAFAGFLHASWLIIPCSAAFLATALITQNTMQVRAVGHSPTASFPLLLGVGRVALAASASVAAFLLGFLSSWLFAF
jgi:hypothetical protein